MSVAVFFIFRLKYAIIFIANMPDIDKKEEALNPESLKQSVSPEQVPGQFEVEKKVEMPQSQEVVPAPVIEGKKEAVPVAPVQGAVTPAPATVKNEIVTKIENILAEDLEDIYFNLPPAKQAEFKKTGEETASSISLLLSGAKIKVKKILLLIMDWLKSIPGINKYFLDQEAKIKTDKILDLKDPGQGGQENQNKI